MARFLLNVTGSGVNREPGGAMQLLGYAVGGHGRGIAGDVPLLAKIRETLLLNPILIELFGHEASVLEIGGRGAEQIEDEGSRIR